MDNIRHPGEDFIDDEWESAVSLQARYPYSPRLEPALEVGHNGLGSSIDGCCASRRTKGSALATGCYFRHGAQNA
jgi:hypothetical protein